MLAMSDTSTQIDPQIVINDLLEQIKRLTLDNSMLRAYINSTATPGAPTTATFGTADDD